MDTEHLIRRLCENVEPVRPLRHPWLRAVSWTAAGAIYFLFLVLIMSPRDDLGARVLDPWFLTEQGAALLMVLTAAIAAFAVSVPGYRRDLVWLPFASATLWVAIVGMGALRDIRLVAPGDALLQADWRCVWTVLAGAAVPAGVMGAMLRRGAPLTPHLTTALGGLAAVGLGNLGVCLFHPHSSNLVVLVWHCGTVFVVAALAGLAGAHVMRWPALERTLPSS